MTSLHALPYHTGLSGRVKGAAVAARLSDPIFTPENSK